MIRDESELRFITHHDSDMIHAMLQRQVINFQFLPNIN